VDAETQRRLKSIRQSRFFGGYDVEANVRSFHQELANGELSATSRPIKGVAFAWCARLLSAQPNVTDLDVFFGAARACGDSDDLRIAEAIRTGYAGDRATALARLAALGTSQSRTASFILASREATPDQALSWLEQAGIAVAELDPDGKFFAIQRYLGAERWEDALTASTALTEVDFEQSPVLLHVAGITNLVQAVPPEIRKFITSSMPNDHFL
jgi:hypothetical protein